MPIYRTGSIASLPYVNYESFPQFLIDAHVFQGSSGSPVFSIVKNEFQFVGILTSSLVRNQRATPIDIKLHTYETSIPLGLGVVLKNELLMAIIYSYKAKFESRFWVAPKTSLYWANFYKLDLDRMGFVNEVLIPTYPTT